MRPAGILKVKSLRAESVSTHSTMEFETETPSESMILPNKTVLPGSHYPFADIYTWTRQTVASINSAPVISDATIMTEIHDGKLQCRVKGIKPYIIPFYPVVRIVCVKVSPDSQPQTLHDALVGVNPDGSASCDILIPPTTAAETRLELIAEVKNLPVENTTIGTVSIALPDCPTVLVRSHPMAVHQETLSTSDD
jgi:hypothetical protein